MAKRTNKNPVTASTPAGTPVRIVNCVEAELPKYAGKTFRTRSDPWRLPGRKSHPGELVVKIEGLAGGFACRCLEIVPEPAKEAAIC